MAGHINKKSIKSCQLSLLLLPLSQNNYKDKQLSSLGILLTNTPARHDFREKSLLLWLFEVAQDCRDLKENGCQSEVDHREYFSSFVMVELKQAELMVFSSLPSGYSTLSQGSCVIPRFLAFQISRASLRGPLGIR